MSKLEESLAVPPVAERRPSKVKVHGDTRVDDYAWLRERDDPDVIAYLEAENDYLKASLRDVDDIRQQLYQEILSCIKEEDVQAPVKHGDFYYYSRTEEKKQHPIMCRKQGNLEAEEQVMLDINLLAAGHEYTRVGVFEVSPDHRLLAYATDHSGDEIYTLKIRDLQTGQDLPDAIDGVYYSLAWSTDCSTVFYTTLDHTKRPYRVHRHVLGTPKDQDEILFQDDDGRFFVYVQRTRSGAFILITSGAMRTTEVWTLPADQPDGTFHIVEPRREDIRYFVEHHGDRFLIRTDDGAPEFRLMQAPQNSPSRQNWTELIGPRDTVTIENVNAFADHIVVSERDEGLTKITVIEAESWDQHSISFPEPVYLALMTNNPEWNTSTLRLYYSSLVTPGSTYDYEIETRELVLKKRQEIPRGYDPEQYESRRLWGTSADGTKVPVSVVFKKGTSLPAPTYLYGYGAYGAAMDPFFVATRLPLLDRGFAFAIGHIRGGGDLGEKWHDQGRLLNKIKVFEDFICCAEALIKEGLSTKGEIAAVGGSAGGTLVGAVANMRPELFKAVVAEVPWVDVVTDMLEPDLPLTQAEYPEVGNPEDKTIYDYQKSYSPYENVSKQGYPHIFVSAGLNDPRVPFWGPAKWVAKLRANKTDDNLILMKINLGAGHGGPSGRYEQFEELALRYSFLLKVFDRV